jgi:hypothetical protein
MDLCRVCFMVHAEGKACTSDGRCACTSTAQRHGGKMLGELEKVALV